MAVGVSRSEVYLVALDPTLGSEIQKTRPCVVISPDELNRFLRTVIVAPMTSKGRLYPSRIPCRFDDRDGHVVLDQIRTVDSVRLVRKLGQLDPETMDRVLGTLSAMFAP